MTPLPSAVKLPTRAMNAPKLTPASLPLMEKAYVPLRLALENLPAGGGGTEGALFPPHAAANNATTAARTNASGFTTPPPLPCRLWGRGAVGSRASCAASVFGCPSGSFVRRIACPRRTEHFHQSRELNHQRQG